MADKQKPENIEWETLPFDFQELARQLMIAEIRAMIRRLQESGEFRIPAEVNFDSLDFRSLKFIKNELRDTLRSLGGAR